MPLPGRFTHRETDLDRNKNIIYMNTHKWLQTIIKWIQFVVRTHRRVLTQNGLPQKCAVQSIHPQHRCPFHTKQNHTRKYSTTKLRENSPTRTPRPWREQRVKTDVTQNGKYGRKWGGEPKGREGREESSAVRSFAEFCFRKLLHSVTYLLEIGIGRHVGNVILQRLLARSIALL